MLFQRIKNPGSVAEVVENIRLYPVHPSGKMQTVEVSLSVKIASDGKVLNVSLVNFEGRE